MRKILFIIPNLKVGGAERVITEMANYLSNDNNVTILTWSSEDIEDSYNLNNNVKRNFLNIDKRNNNFLSKFFFSLFRLFKIRKYFKKNNPEIIISFLEVTNIFTLIASLGLRKKIFISERSNPENIPYVNIQKDSSFNVNYKWHILRKIFYRFANIVVVQTRETEKWFKNNVYCKTMIIPNHIRDLPILYNKREKTILSVGRLTSEKGVDTLIRAFSMCMSEIKSWNLVIGGDGKERKNLEKLSLDLNIGQRIKFTGYKSTPEDYMSKAGIYILSSKFEGFPNALLEAMAMGTPVISSNCKSGPADIIVEGHNGLFFNVDDKIELSETILKLVKEENLRKKFSINSAIIKNDYNISKIMLKWEKLFNE